MATGHAGRKILLSRLRKEPLLLSGITKLVQEATQSCLACYLSNPEKFTENKTENLSMQPSLRPYSQIYVDCIEVRVDQKSTTFLTLLDGFSLRLSVERLQSKEASKIVPKLMLLLTEFGCSGRSNVVSDNGLEFMSSAMQTTLELMQINTSQISPYNSRANRSERAHRDLRSLLRTVNFSFKDTEFVVRMATAMYNNRPKGSLQGKTPNEICMLIPEPLMFDKYSLPADNIVKVNDEIIQNHLAYFSDLQLKVAKSKVENYAIKDQTINHPLKLGDYVVISPHGLIVVMSSQDRDPEEHAET